MPESTWMAGMVSRVKATITGGGKPAGGLLSELFIEKYTYKGLSDPSTEIRLLKILPGVNKAPLIVQIDHMHLIDRGISTNPGLSQRMLEDINETLPTGWVAYKTLSQRVIYFNSELESSTWHHPAVGESMSSQENTVEPAPDGSANTPLYEALSYTWGSTKGRKVIYVQHPDGEHRKILVTRNLALALRHLRSTTAKRTLWVDAICINQEDVEERNTQVQRMTSIYRLARRVVVWLGPASHSSSLAMSTLQYLGEQIEFSARGHIIPTPDAVERHWYKNEFDLPYDVGTWEAVMSLCGRPYFNRLWIMQELHLSNHHTIIQCGSDSMSWENMRKAVQCIFRKKNLPPPRFGDRLLVVVQLADYNAQSPFDQLTGQVHSRNCSDNRDRVYGLLGLMPEGLRDRTTPDYDITIGEVYRQATVAQIEFFRRLDVLEGCGPHRAIIDEPSWVPNLAVPHFRTFEPLSASGISRCDVAFDTPNVAKVSGLQVGSVNSVQQEKERWKLGEGIERTKAWAYQDLDRDVYALTLCGMFVKERFYGNAVPSLEEWKRFYFEDLDDTDETDQVITHFFLAYVEGCIFLRTLFIMGDGQIGLGPETMKTGDAVCVFLGCDSPMIIRQKSDGTYQVIGEAFVYGLRDANALLGPLPEPWLVQEMLSQNGRPVFLFVNEETDEMTKNDPRLGPLIGWERLDVDIGVDDPPICQKFKNIENG